MSVLDPDKSIDTYAFLGAEGLSVTFSSPFDWGKKTATYVDSYSPSLPMHSGGVKIAESDIGVTDHSGRFQWNAYQTVNGIQHQRGSAYWMVAPFTGAMQTGSKYSDSPVDMMQTPSNLSRADNWALSYGFFDSGMGLGGVTNHDQSYVYLTPDMSHWMGRVVE